MVNQEKVSVKKTSCVNEEVNSFIETYEKFIRNAIKFVEGCAQFYEEKRPAVTVLNDALNASIAFLDNPGIETYAVLKDKQNQSGEMARETREERIALGNIKGPIAAVYGLQALEFAAFAVSNVAFTALEVICLDNGELVIREDTKQMEIYSSKGCGIGVMPIVADRLGVVKDMVEKSIRYEKVAGMEKRSSD